MNWISTMGRASASASPTPRPVIACSEMGVSRTRSGPKRSLSPVETPKTPPPSATSSPKRRIRSSAAIAWWCASLRAPAYERIRFSSASVLGGGVSCHGSSQKTPAVSISGPGSSAASAAATAASIRARSSSSMAAVSLSGRPWCSWSRRARAGSGSRARHDAISSSLRTGRSFRSECPM